MNLTLVKAFGALAPVGVLFLGSVLMCARARTAAAILELTGAAGLLVVVLSHICEALRVLPWMGWGLEHSAGHYLDLAGAVIGVTLFPAGYLLHALSRRAA